MVLRFRLISLCCLAAGTCLVASGQNYVKLLQNDLKSATLNLVNPATTDVVAGGLVVSDGNIASYNSLPTAVSFKPSAPTQESFYASTNTKSFSLAALLSGIGSVLNAGLSVNHNNTTTINQIDATAQSVRAEDVVANGDVSKLIKTWIQAGDKKPKYSVYVVIKTYSSKTISVSDMSSTGVAAAFGTDLPTCPDASGSTDAKGASGQTSATGGGGAKGASGAPAKGATASSGGKGASGATGVPGAAAGAVVAKPTASLKFCSNSSSKVSLNAANPLIFAVAVRPVTFDAQGNLVSGPVSVVLKPAQVGALTEPEPIAINGKKTHTRAVFPAK